MTALDPTFRNYGNQQAAAYATNRGSYSLDIHQQVLEYHTDHGGKLGTVLDVGCGTGQATRPLGSFFSQATGCDPGVEMIAQAREIGGKTKDRAEIQYEVLGAEELEQSTTVEPGSVDLLAAAMAVNLYFLNYTHLISDVYCRPTGSICATFGHRLPVWLSRVVQLPFGRCLHSTAVSYHTGMKSIDLKTDSF
jgi:SAM-dependent methyltransferase